MNLYPGNLPVTDPWLKHFRSKDRPRMLICACVTDYMRAEQAVKCYLSSGQAVRVKLNRGFPKISSQRNESVMSGTGEGRLSNLWSYKYSAICLTPPEKLENTKMSTRMTCNSLITWLETQHENLKLFSEMHSREINDVGLRRDLRDYKVGVLGAAEAANT